jgi:hypothetical protein
VPGSGPAESLKQERHAPAGLSPAGRKALTRAESALASVQNDVLSGLDDDERRTLHTLLLRAAAKQIANDTRTDGSSELGPCLEAADTSDSC